MDEMMNLNTINNHPNNFKKFVTNHFFNTDGSLLGLPMEEINKKMIGTKNNLTKEQLKTFHKDKYVETDKGVYNMNIKNPTHFELRLRHTDNIVCIDIDGLIDNGDCCLTDIWGIPHFKELFIDCPYTLSRNKKLPHFYFYLDDIDINQLSNTYVDCFKNCKADILFNHCWEKINENQMYNYTNDLPFFKYEDIKHLFKDGVLDKKEPKPIQTQTFTNSNELVNELLNIIDVQYLNNYADWCKIVWSSKNCGADEEFIRIISQKSPSYTDDGFKNVFSSTYPAYTIGTIKYYAKLSDSDKYLTIIQSKDVNFNIHEPITDYNLAYLFKQLCGDNFIFQHNVLYIYYNNKWRIDDTHRITKQFIQETLLEFMNHYKKQYANSDITNPEDLEAQKVVISKVHRFIQTVQTINQTTHICENFINIIASEQVDYENIFDDKPYIFCFSNKCYDLKEGTEIIVKKEDYIIQNTHYEYVEPTKDQYELIDLLFRQIFPNPEIRKCYLSVLFMGMTGIQVEKFFLANGSGRNGKGLIHDLYSKLLGDDYFYKLSPDVLTSKVDLAKGANPQVANCDNKRCIISSEPEDDAHTKIRMPIVKEMTGCGTIAARQLYSTKTIVRMRQTQILECNKKPQLSGRIDPSVMDRIVDVPFVSYFTENSEEWDETLNKYPLNLHFKSSDFQLSHRCALFKYIINNSPKELYIPNIIIERSKKYVMNNDELYEWFMEHYEQGEDNDILKMKDVYKLFQDSDLFLSKTKDQKRTLNYKGFIELVGSSIAFKGKYYNDQKKINGTSYYERIVKYKLKILEPEVE